MTVLELLNWSTHYLGEHRVENPRLDAELLVVQALHLSREELYTLLHSQVKEEDKETLEGLLRRRGRGEPLQYISGRQEFWSIDLRVDPNVLIPRPETELLVEKALSVLSSHPFQRTPLVLDLGTGSGAIAVALAKEVENIFLIAADISREALALARKNAFRAGVQHKIAFLNGDLFGPFRKGDSKGVFDLILSNPPYVVRPEIEGLAEEVRREPAIALNGGEDGLDFYRRILSQADSFLREGGCLLLEIGQGQALKVTDLMKESGQFREPQVFRDLSGIERVVKAQRGGR